MPDLPQGSAAHPILIVSIGTSNGATSSAFYTAVFGWQFATLSPALTVSQPNAGPTVALRSGTPAVAQGVVPLIQVANVPDTLAAIAAAGGSTEREPWSVPGIGTLARFRDPSGTIYGLTSGMPASAMPRVGMPVGSAPKPVVNTVCSLEMYAASGDAAATFFGALFGWASLRTMESYMAFDPGAGIGGVFQSHTPAHASVAYVWVTDAAATLDAIDAAGGARLGAPMAIPGFATFGYFTDPSGTMMGLMAPAPGA